MLPSVVKKGDSLLLLHRLTKFLIKYIPYDYNAHRPPRHGLCSLLFVHSGAVRPVPRLACVCMHSHPGPQCSSSPQSLTQPHRTDERPHPPPSHVRQRLSSWSQVWPVPSPLHCPPVDLIFSSVPVFISLKKVVFPTVSTEPRVDIYKYLTNE